MTISLFDFLLIILPFTAGYLLGKSEGRYKSNNKNLITYI